MGASDPAYDPRGRTEQQRISEAVAAIGESRAVIEQAKGMLVFVYGTDADEAFRLLRWQSQHHNVKLRLIAEQIIEDLVARSKSKPALDRLDSHQLVHTAHLRIGDVAARADGEDRRPR